MKIWPFLTKFSWSCSSSDVLFNNDPNVNSELSIIHDKVMVGIQAVEESRRGSDVKIQAHFTVGVVVR